MLSECLFFMLVSNLSAKDGVQALIDRGMSLDFLDKSGWGFVPIHTKEQWEDVFMMLVDALETEDNPTLDRLLVHIECPPLALREALR